MGIIRVGLPQAHPFGPQPPSRGRGGWVKLDPSYGPSVTLLVASAPGRSGGVGGWEASERSGRLPAKWWKARTDSTLPLDLILDRDHPIPVMIPRPITGTMMTPQAVGGAPAGLAGLAGRLTDLHQMGVPHSGHERPPTIKVTGDVWSLDKRLTWVLDDMTLGDRLFDGSGNIRRQNVSLTLSRFTEVDEIEALTIKPTRTGKKHRKRRRTIHTKAGDTLRAVALRELGAGGRWKDLKRWNKKKLAKVNPDARLRVGTVLRLDDDGGGGANSDLRGAGPGVRD